jgi:hypothetical protein
MQLLHEYNPAHKLFKTTVAEFLTMPIKNWSFNRPADKTRCKEIAEHIQSKPIETLFYLAEIDGTYEMLDGIHRYTALKMIPVDYITDSIAMSYILLNIRINPTKGELVDFFESFNKSIPVPDLYFENPDQVKRHVITAIIDKWEKNYPTHFSTARKYQRPHINRTALTDILSDVYDKYATDEITADELEERLNIYNDVVYNKWKDVETPKMAIKKCKESGLWLFMAPDEIINA